MTYRLRQVVRNDVVVAHSFWGGADRIPRNRITTKPNPYVRREMISSSGVYTVSGHIGALPTVFRRALLIAQNDVIAKARSTFDDALLCADLVYAKSTVELVTLYAKMALASAKKLRKGDFSALAKALDLLKDPKRRAEALSAVPSRWLEFQFCLLPLKGTIEALCEIVDNPFSRTRIRAVSRIQDRRVINYQWGTLASNLTGIAYVRGYVRVANVNQGSLMRSGLTDYIGLAWDITPWSWAASYFSNAGDYLQNINPRYDQLIYEDFCYGYMLKDDGMTAGKYHPSYTGRFSEFEMRRDVGRLPDITFQFQDNLSLGRAANLLSAISLTLKGKMK